MYSVVGADGQVYGPVDMATLAGWIAEGRVTPETTLIDPLDGRTLPAGSAPALVGTFPPAPGPLAPGPAAPVPVAPIPRAPYVDPAAGAPGFYPRGAPVAYLGPPKSKLTAALLALLLGWLGVHRFYLGRVGSGVAMVALFLLGPCSCWTTWIALGLWIVVDLVLVLTDSLREPNGRALT